MKAHNDDDLAMHDLQTKAVMSAIAKLGLRPLKGGQPLTPEAIFEGAVKGAAVHMIAVRQVGAVAVAELLEDMARAFREEANSIDGKPN